MVEIYLNCKIISTILVKKWLSITEKSGCSLTHLLLIHDLGPFDSSGMIKLSSDSNSDGLLVGTEVICWLARVTGIPFLIVSTNDASGNRGHLC